MKDKDIGATLRAVATAALFSVAFCLPARAAQTHYEDRECLSCHSAKIKSAKLKRTIEAISHAMFEPTPHKKLKCTDCHSTAVLHDKPKTHMAAISPVDCGQCHYKGNKAGAPDKDITKQYTMGSHGKLRIGKHNTDAPACKDCHGFHIILPPDNPASTISRLNEHITCGKCHGNRALMSKYKISAARFARYQKSAHGIGIEKKGLNISATCSDCHGSHDIRNTKNAASPMNRRNQPRTCAKCHQGIYIVYRTSIHGKEWRKGNPDVPVCVNCHGEHDIAEVSQSGSKVSAANIGNTCGACHTKVPLAKKYGMPSDRLKSFKNSFHGASVTLNGLSAANCASCHGTHNILPSSDPRSTISKRNLPKTCGNCHPEAKKNKNLAGVHKMPDPGSSKILYYVKLAYILLIAGSVGGFLFFIATDLLGTLRRKKSGH